MDNTDHHTPFWCRRFPPQREMNLRYLRRHQIRTYLSLHFSFFHFSRTDIHRKEYEQISEIPEIFTDHHPHRLISPTRIEIYPAWTLPQNRIRTV